MRDSVEVAGRTRTYTVVGEPARDLVLIFHGSGQTGDKHREFTGRAFDALADGGAATVVYPDGFKKNWNDARRESRFPARQENIDDVAFVRAVIQKFHPVRVFAAGYSNGGQMVLRLMHEAPELLSGAAVFAALMPVPENFLVPPGKPAPMPVVLIHGTKDPIVGYAGGPMAWWVRALFKVGGSTLSMPGTARYFADRNGITAEPVSTTLPRSGKTSVERTEYRQEGHEPVVLYTVHGGGHTVPGPHKAPALVGPTNQDVNAADLIGDLFGIAR